MTKLQIVKLNLNTYPISLNYQIQKEVQGGINMKLYNLLETNKKDSVVSYGNISSNAFMLNIIIDYGSNNQIYQSSS